MRLVGAMSGTSADGVDAVLAAFDAESPAGRVLAHHHLAYPDALRAEVMALNRPGGVDELHRAALAANGVAMAYAQAIEALLSGARLAPHEVRAIGAHGQTVRHQPGRHDGRGYTLQLLNAALLAESTGIAVIADLRSRDVAAGGQGAPLVPAFHAARFARPGRDVAVLNLGGIANLTLLPAAGPVRGFDTGPANVLMDGWAWRHQGCPFDASGAWAARAAPEASLLALLRRDPYFDLAPPKSTGREHFDLPWLDAALAGFGPVNPGVVMSTLLELTATTVADALRRHAPGTRVLHLCGGGARNAVLAARIAALLPGVAVADTAVLGVPPEQVEALAFAWLAHEHLAGRPGSRAEVTGARGARVLGACYPA
jgi:anhydro-N-acetylmuramic acid kinase